MPNYDYTCTDCGPFVALVPMARRDRAQDCPECGRRCPRDVSAPQLLLMSPLGRHAAATNERSAHEPRVHHRHSSSCGCGKKADPSVRTGAPGTPAPPRRRRPKRPWMLGH